MTDANQNEGELLASNSRTANVGAGQRGPEAERRPGQARSCTVDALEMHSSGRQRMHRMCRLKRLLASALAN